MPQAVRRVDGASPVHSQALALGLVDRYDGVAQRKTRSYAQATTTAHSGTRNEAIFYYMHPISKPVTTDETTTAAATKTKCVSRALVRTVKMNVDSGCTMVIMDDRRALTSERKDATPILVSTADGDSKPMTSTAVGTATIKTNNGQTMTLNRVAVIPTVTEPLLSVAALNDCGAEVRFKPFNGGVVVERAGEVLLRGERIANRFTIDAEVMVNEAAHEDAAGAAAQMNSKSQTGYGRNAHTFDEAMGLTTTEKDARTTAIILQTHARLGHLSAAGMERLVRAKAVSGLPHDVTAVTAVRRALNTCKVCLSAKMTRKPVTGKGDNDKVQFGTRVVADIAGPLRLKKKKRQIHAFGKARYFQVLREAKGRVLRVDVLQHKNEAATKVEEFVAWLERTSGVLVKEFHSDGDTVYTGDPLARWLRRRGIKATTTTRDTPEHNALAERTVRTVMEMTRAMHKHAGVPHAFWPLTVKAAEHVLQRTLSSSVADKTPIEQLVKKKPDVEHLRTYGCDVMYRVPPSARRWRPQAAGSAAEVLKLRDRAVEGMFVGYAEDDRESYYCVYDPLLKQVVKTRDVEFFETEFTVATKLRRMPAWHHGQSEVEDDDELFIPHDEPSDLLTPLFDSDAMQTDSENGDEKADEAKTIPDDENGDEKNVATAETDSLTEPAAGDDEKKAMLQTQPRPALRTLPARPGRGAGVHQPFFVNYAESGLFRPSRRNMTSPQQDDNSVSGNLQTQAERDDGKDNPLEDDSDDGRISATDSEGEEFEADAANDDDKEFAGTAKGKSKNDDEDDYAMMARRANKNGDPATFAEAISGKDAQEWWESMRREYGSQKEKGTFELVEWQPHMNVLQVKWVYKTKRDENGTVTIKKSRITPKGFQQRLGIDYKETFAPVMRYSSMRILLAEAARNDWEVEQADIGTAFLNADIEEDVFVEQPSGFEQYGPKGERMVWRLKKSVYGIKQAPRNWYKTLRRVLEENGLCVCKTDASVYVGTSVSGRRMYIAVWVDDLWFFYDKRDSADFKKVEGALMTQFKMKPFQELRSMLGLRVRRNRSRRELTIDQEAYAKEALKALNMAHCKPVDTPMVDKKLSKLHGPTTEEEMKEMATKPYRDAVGRLMWMSGQTRPDIAFPVGVLARFMANPGRDHWTNLKRVLRYVCGTTDAKLVYSDNRRAKAGVCVLEAFSDADWASDVDGRRSTTGYLVMVNGNLVSWSSKKQPTVALSTAEAEYMGMSAATEELCWTRQFVAELGLDTENPAVLFTDNQAAKTIAEGDVSSQRTKHIDIRHHFVRDAVAQQNLEIRWTSTEKQLADLLTKCVPAPARFKALRRQILECGNDD